MEVAKGLGGRAQACALRQRLLEDEVVSGVIALHFLVGRSLVQCAEPGGCVGVAGVVPQPEASHDWQICSQPLHRWCIHDVCQAELPGNPNIRPQGGSTRVVSLHSDSIYGASKNAICSHKGPCRILG